MATGQFTVYTSNDPYGPGQISGSVGDFIRVLNACLVNGYGTGSYYKAPAGWTKPLPDNDGSGTFAVPVLGCFKQGSGSGVTMFVNDSGGNLLNTSCAYVVGWESMTSLTSSVWPTGGKFSGSYTVGYGTGQFPQPGQTNALTYGYAIFKKTSDTTAKRNWLLIADASTIHWWNETEHYPGLGNLYHQSFGDCYSLLGPNDIWKCIVYGPISISGIVNSQDWTDVITLGQNTSYGNFLGSTAQPAHWINRTGFGGGISIPFNKRGDTTVSPTPTDTTSPYGCTINGVLQTPNVDGYLYIAPLEVVEPNGGGPVIRGRIRGLYQVGHPTGNFYHGQTISGSGDYAGKVFMIVKQSYSAVRNSFWAVDISSNLDTN